MKENYEEKVLLLTKRYEEQQGNICVDLKLVAMLTVLQSGYTKLFCFYMNWTAKRGTGTTH
jgi:hypothetical protein